MTPAYYNEFDPYAAQWLRNLIAAGHIAPGDVDERSILEVTPDDLRRYGQCHFFAGIGGWSYALRIAGVPDDRPIWTGSCPCQPFSAAGKRRGSEDERHLWPALFNLIRECRPASVLGEQVAGAAGLAWLDHVCADLEDAGYAAAAADLCAAGAGAPHIRQRLYWVAHAECWTAERRRHDMAGPARIAESEARQRQRVRAEFGASGDVCGLAHADDCNECADSSQPNTGADGRGFACGCGAVGELADPASQGLQRRTRCSSNGEGIVRGQSAEGSEVGGLANPTDSGPQGSEPAGQRVDAQRAAAERTGALDHFADLAWIECSDGKARPTQLGIFPLAHGLPGGGMAVSSAVPATEGTEEGEHIFSRVGVLRGAGNAIVPQVAAAFICAAGVAT